MASYDTNDISSCLGYLMKRFGIGIFSTPGRATSLLRDLAPALVNERGMIERMSRRGILTDLAKADEGTVPEKERAIRMAFMTLVDMEYIAPNIAVRYIRIFTDLFDWGLPVDLPGSGPSQSGVWFDPRQHAIDSEDPIYRSAMEARENQRHTEAFQLFGQAYHQGNLLAGIKLAMLHRSGLGCPRSDDKAIRLFMLIHKDGHPLATAWLAEHYRKGRGVPADLQQAGRLYHSSRAALEEMAVFGEPDAQYTLGFDLLYGSFEKQDPPQAFVWLEKAAPSCSEARTQLALCYLNGWGCAADTELGLSILQLQADRGAVSANFELGWLYYSGTHVTQDYHRAFPLLEYAARKDHSAAQYYLGDMYYWGKGVPKDDAKSFHWNKKSADNGHRMGCQSVAYQYWNGCGVPENEALAFRFFKEAADKGVENAQYTLHYFLGGFAEDKSFTDRALCIQYLEMAANNGFSQAALRLGELYQDENFGIADNGKHLQWLTHAAQQGNAHAQFLLGIDYLNGVIVGHDLKAAVRWFESAAGQKHVDAAIFLAELYLTRDAICDKERAYEYLDNAADMLTCDECSRYYAAEYLRYRIGYLYMHHSRTDNDRQKAFELYCRALAEGGSYALYYVGWMYFVDGCRSNYSPVDKQALMEQLLAAAPTDPSPDLAYLLGLIYHKGYYSSIQRRDAEKWWLMALEKGSLSAYDSLTLLYANDLKQFDDAFRMAKRGHEAGSIQSTYFLAQCYTQGIGVKKSRSQAKEYFRHAAKNGHKAAQRELKKFLF